MAISVLQRAGKALRETAYPPPAAGSARQLCPPENGQSSRVLARRDGPIRRSLALCSFRPLTRRRCGSGGGGGRGCSGLGLLGWQLRLVAMEWGSESAAVRRHRVGGERRDGPAAAPPPEREARAQEPLVDGCGGGGGRTRKRSLGGSGGASRSAGTGLSEARAALGLALYLLALRTLVQLSLQQLVLRGAAGHHGEFDALQARYRPLPPATARVSVCGSCPGPGAPHLCAPATAVPRGLADPSQAARGVGGLCFSFFWGLSWRDLGLACPPFSSRCRLGLPGRLNLLSTVCPSCRWLVVSRLPIFWNSFHFLPCLALLLSKWKFVYLDRFINSLWGRGVLEGASALF